MVYGCEVYPTRDDLYKKRFYKCDQCGNFVGTHQSKKEVPTELGCIPTKEIKVARQHIHRLIDPIWSTGKMSRGSLYKVLSDRLGWHYHTANIRSVEEARQVYRLLIDIRKQLGM